MSKDFVLTKYELIDRMISELDQVTIQGIHNIRLIGNVAAELNVLKKGLQEEDNHANNKDQQGQNI